MAHYAFLDDNNIVTEVITGIDETELIEGLDPETWYGNFRGQVCKRTSYNSLAGKRIVGDSLSEQPGFRKNYARIGYTYDEDLDAFIPPKPFNSWILDEETCQWKPLVFYPNDGKDYTWDEDSVSWKELDTNG